MNMVESNNDNTSNNNDTSSPSGGIVRTCFRVFWSRLLPVIVISTALVFGWLSRQELPEGTFFATVIPLLKGYRPPTIFGHGHMVGTPPVPPDLKPQPRPKKELFLRLAGTGDKMPQNGLGMCCRPTAYDEEMVRRTVLWYLLSGGRVIDGAHLYLNHRAIGEGIRQAVERGVPRKEIFVTTKIFSRHFGYNTTKQTVPTYLDELGLDYIDLVLMHFPITLPLQNTECSKLGLSKRQCREETWKALSELRKEGVTRNVGVSNFHVEQLKELQDLKTTSSSSVIAPIAVNQFQYNPWSPDHAEETFQYCREHKIAVTAYNSLAGAFQYAQTGRVKPLTDLANVHNKSVAQIMLRWALQMGVAIIPGTGNPKHMKENLNVYSSFQLSEDDMNAINALRSDESARKFFSLGKFE